MTIRFTDWTKNREVETLGTNAGSEVLPFQSWKVFKEAFAPELVFRAINESDVSVSCCFDPFGGSGTTALACQFLDIMPVTAEVNPFLADLIEAKLTHYDCDELASDLGRVANVSASVDPSKIRDLLKHLPPTFVEPGINERWLFNVECADAVNCIIYGIDQIRSSKSKRLFKVVLGGILVEVSNARVSGKGRRYRKNWSQRAYTKREIYQKFFHSARSAIAEIHKFSRRSKIEYELVRGDVLSANFGQSTWDISVFSPPYPNSFDYTDVYNIELWMLGYLKDFEENRSLRTSTLASHVQVSREFADKPKGSVLLDQTIEALEEKKSILWDQRIPCMVGAYFSDMLRVLEVVRAGLQEGGEVWMVVGDSKYSGVHVPTAEILIELGRATGWNVRTVEAFRSMRVSAQQGGAKELNESLVVLN